MLFSSFLNLVITAMYHCGRNIFCLHKQILDIVCSIVCGQGQAGCKSELDLSARSLQYLLAWVGDKSRCKKVSRSCHVLFHAMGVVLLHPRSINFGKNLIIDIMCYSLLQLFCIDFPLFLEYDLHFWMKLKTCKAERLAN